MSIKLGSDPIVGLSAPYILSNDPREYLEYLGISSLGQAQNLDYGTVGQDYWYFVDDLNLGGIWKKQWFDYVFG